MLLKKYLPTNLLFYAKSTSIKTLAFSLLIIGFILAFLLDLALGSVSIPIQEVINILLGQEPEKATHAHILLKFRLPKALTATLAGAALGVSGLQMQTLFKNPLAGPFVLGISSGASLGVALVVLTASVTTPTLLNDLGIISVIFMGAILALVADLCSQVWVSQMVLPLNAITALIGTPVVSWVILRRK